MPAGFPWLSLAIWLVTYLLSSSDENISKGKAALLATAAGLASWYLVDPANPTNLAGISYPQGWVDANGNLNVGDLDLPSWVLPAAGGAILGSGISGWVADNWKWLLAGVVGLLILWPRDKEQIVIRSDAQ